MVKMKLKESDKIDRLSIDHVFSSVSSQWCTEIARALEFFYSNYPGERVPKVFVSGGGSYIESFRSDLALHIEAEVILLNPFQVIHTDKSGFTEEELDLMSPELCVALGLGLRKMGDQ